MTLKKEWLVAAGIPSKIADDWILPLEAAMDEFMIGLTTNRIAMFLAQIAHETMGLTRVVENLNYSAEGLMKTWQKRFPTVDIAKQFEHNPEKIANFVYAGRNGNGDPSSGDGWKFRGRGPIQITGRANYLAAHDRTWIECVTYPELLELPPYGSRASASWWSSHGLNGLADNKNFDKITLVINGEMNGSEDRHKRWSDVQVVMDSQ